MALPSYNQTVGRFKINKKRVLGKGGDGVVVYEGFDDTTNKPVAVKRIDKDNLNNEKHIMKKTLKYENLAPYLASEENENFV